MSHEKIPQTPESPRKRLPTILPTATYTDSHEVISVIEEDMSFMEDLRFRIAKEQSELDLYLNDFLDEKLRNPEHTARARCAYIIGYGALEHTWKAKKFPSSQETERRFFTPTTASEPYGAESKLAELDEQFDKPLLPKITPYVIDLFTLELRNDPIYTTLFNAKMLTVQKPLVKELGYFYQKNRIAGDEIEAGNEALATMLELFQIAIDELHSDRLDT